MIPGLHRMDSMITASENVAEQVPPPACVGARTAQGAFWTLLFSALSKVIALGSQIALAWFLVPEQIGLVALALSVTSVIALMLGGNLRNVLVQAQENFETQAGQVFWLSLAMNVAAALLLALLAPLAGWLFGEPRVVPLILIVAASVPTLALSTVYSAALYRDLRFRALARVLFVEGLIRNGGAVALAALGFGASAIVLPFGVAALFSTIACRVLAGRIRLGRPEPRQWPALLTPAAWLMAIALVTAVQTYGTNFIIGLRHTSTVAGLYYWGFTFASQAIFLLAANLQSVFFSALSKLTTDTARQRAAFRQLCGTLIFALAPVCVLQAVLARPAIELLFHERWLPAVPVVQWLSLGLLTQPLNILAGALLMARGDFRRLALLNGAVALTVVMAAAVGAQVGAQAEIAGCTGAALLLANLLAAWWACRDFCGGTIPFLRQAAAPLFVAVPLGALAWFAAFAVAGHSPAIIILVTTLIVLGVFVASLRVFAPEYLGGLLARFRLREAAVERHEPTGSQSLP